MLVGKWINKTIEKFPLSKNKAMREKRKLKIMKNDVFSVFSDRLQNIWHLIKKRTGYYVKRTMGKQ